MLATYKTPIERGNGTGSTASSTVARRFWALLLAVLVLAVSGSALAVRHTATPFLEEQQKRAVAEQAGKDARSLDSMLARKQMLIELVGTNIDVTNVAMGYVAATDIVRDYLTGLPRMDGFAWIRVTDIHGEALAEHRVEAGSEADFPAEAERALAAAVASDEPGAVRRVLYRVEDGVAHLVIAAPVKNRDFTEGAVLAGLRLDLAEVFPRNEVARATYILPSGPAADPPRRVPEGAAVVPLDSLDLAIVLVPDIAAVAAAGRHLLANSVGVVALVLTGAFGLFAWLGRAAIVAPHMKLEEQKAALAELAAVAELANDAIVVTGLDGRVVWCNPAFETLSGYSADEVRGKSPGALLQGPGTNPETAASMAAAMRRREPITTEILNYRRDGQPFWLSIGITPLRNDRGEAYGFTAISHDVTEAKRQQEAILEAKRAIEIQALQDPLTGLPNRRALDAALKARSADPEAGATIVRIDLDHFKYVNDTMGHEAGDFVLCEIARILDEETRADDLPARVGGDEFVLLLGPGRSAQDGRLLAQRMLERIRAPKRLDTRTIRIGASFGVASTLDGLLPLEELIIGADAALYEAKDQGRNRICLYTPALHRAVHDRRELAREIRLAIQNEEFEPRFQPQFDATTLEISGVETLVRWQSPTLGLLAPAAFMPVAQQLSVVEEIDSIVFRKAFDQILALRAEGIEIGKIAFNVTAERIEDEASYRVVTERVGCGPEIAFEILESVLVEEQTDLFRFSLDRLRDAGISIEIDDFGSGHASIIGLMHLMPDVMKIDRRLVAPIVASGTARALLKQIVGMAELTGLKVTAEGVETLEHARILTDLGCDTLQGFAFCPPLSAAELRRFVRLRATGDWPFAGPGAAAPSADGDRFPGLFPV